MPFLSPCVLSALLQRHILQQQTMTAIRNTTIYTETTEIRTIFSLERDAILGEELLGKAVVVVLLLMSSPVPFVVMAYGTEPPRCSEGQNHP
jgi:hypothetical protein